jgi:hypothetical protein
MSTWLAWCRSALGAAQANLRRLALRYRTKRWRSLWLTGRRPVVDIAGTEAFVDAELLELRASLDDGVDEVAVAQSISSVIDRAAARLLESTLTDVERATRRWMVERKLFESRVDDHWGTAFRLLEGCFEALRDAGSQFNSSFRPAAAELQSYGFEVLVGLHARGCRIGAAVVALLRSGFGTDALQLTRSLEELAVVGRLMMDHGDDLAERYLAYEHVQNLRDALEYNAHCAELGLELISDDELCVLRDRKSEALSRHGRYLDDRNGWASVLGQRNPSQADLERKAGMAHNRPMYSLASHFIHPSPKGGRLAIADEGSVRFVEVGPNAGGLADAGSAMVHSLLQLTTSLVAWQPATAVRSPSPSLPAWLAVTQALTELVSQVDELLRGAHLAYESHVDSSARRPTTH